MSPIIAVTGTARRFSPSWWCIRLALRLAGAKPHRISVNRPDIPAGVNGFVISGGDDIHPEHYLESFDKEIGDTDFDVERDRLEIECIRYAIDKDLPLLGICRGAQLINVVLGGSLHQDINPMRKRTSKKAHLRPRKTVHLEADSGLANIVETTRLRVNSLHKQAVDRLGEELIRVGADLDSITQAIESKDRIVGVQWHPEYLIVFRVQRRIFKWLAGAAAQRRDRDASAS